jgi:hypothetical protein
LPDSTAWPRTAGAVAIKAPPRHAPKLAGTSLDDFDLWYFGMIVLLFVLELARGLRRTGGKASSGDTDLPPENRNDD